MSIPWSGFQTCMGRLGFYILLWMTKVAQYVFLVRRCLKILHFCFLAFANLDWHLPQGIGLKCCSSVLGSARLSRMWGLCKCSLLLWICSLFCFSYAWHFCRGGSCGWTLSCWCVCKEANQTPQSRWVLNGGFLRTKPLTGNDLVKEHANMEDLNTATFHI